MSNDSFKAYFVSEEKDGGFRHEITEVPFSFLPDNDVLIQVHYSSLNYKDALSASGNTGVTRSYPHIPGIDASGTVVKDRNGIFQEGKEVIVTGYDLGSNTSGGFGEFIKVPDSWVVSMPESLSPKSAMIYGTAGFTAMYGILLLQRNNIVPDSGEILVTGATGGVGSLAVFFLSQMGYSVTAATGKTDQSVFLKELGASSVIHRDEVSDVSGKLLLSGRWNGAIETVGGSMLDAVIRQVNPDGAIACCGNILGHELNTNIYPFILRGLSLLGIDSAICKMPRRLKIWSKLASIDQGSLPKDYYKAVALEELQPEIDLILKGKQTGRVILSHK